MDSEEHKEIQKAIWEGRSETDEGPYYHESWWESYKGSVKGKLGGAIVGGLVGAVAGIAAAVALASTVGLAGISAAALIGAFSGAGLLYGQHEFSDVGKVTGAVAAAQEKAEQRMKSFEKGKFDEIKKDIGDIKRMLSGNRAADEPMLASAQTAPAQQEENYRTTHCDEHCPPEKRKWVFWKIAAIGLAVGLAAGAILAGSGMVGVIAEHLGSKLGELLSAYPFTATMTTLGAFGASFGVNRDTFREIFDKTDLWFKGILRNGKSRAHQLGATPEKEQITEKSRETKPATVVVYENFPDYPASNTHYQDKHAAKQALLSMDHTKSLPN